jgi:hypothetical protein
MNYDAFPQFEVAKVGKLLQSEKTRRHESFSQSSLPRVQLPRLFSGESSTKLTPAESGLFRQSAKVFSCRETSLIASRSAPAFFSGTLITVRSILSRSFT